ENEPFDDGQVQVFMFRLIMSVILNVVVFGGLLFLPAGTLRWWRAWVFIGVVFIAAVATMASVFRSNEDLLNERYKLPIQKGQPLADKIILTLFIAAFLALIVFIPLDVFRFHLTAEPGAVVSSLGLVLFVMGWWIIALSFKENA